MQCVHCLANHFWQSGRSYRCLAGKIGPIKSKADVKSLHKKLQNIWDFGVLLFICYILKYVMKLTHFLWCHGPSQYFAIFEINNYFHLYLFVEVWKMNRKVLHRNVSKQHRVVTFNTLIAIIFNEFKLWVHGEFSTRDCNAIFRN